MTARARSSAPRCATRTAADFVRAAIADGRTVAGRTERSVSIAHREPRAGSGLCCVPMAAADERLRVADRRAARGLHALVRGARLGAARASARTAGEARAGRSALLIAPTGAGKTLAGFLPTLVELSAERAARSVCSLPPCGGRVGGGGLASSSAHARWTPTPDPSPQGGGEQTAPARGIANPNASSSPPAAASAARAGCTRSTSRRSRRSRSTSRAISNGRSPRWSCRSASRRAPATRRPRSASASGAIRPTSCSPRPSSSRCCSPPPTRRILFGSLRRVILDELHSLVMSKRGDLLSLGLARLFTIAPQLATVGLSATVAEPDDLRRYLVPQTRRRRAAPISCSPSRAPRPTSPCSTPPSSCPGPATRRATRSAKSTR